MKQQTNSRPDHKTELKRSPGEQPGPDSARLENDTSPDESKHSVDEIMQGQHLENKDREGDATDTDEALR